MGMYWLRFFPKALQACIREQLISGSRPEREFTKDNMSLKTYLQTAFRWQAGRQKSGYDKMLLITGRWPILFDSYLIRYPVGSEILAHTDPVLDKQHYRFNIIIKKSNHKNQ